MSMDFSFFLEISSVVPAIWAQCPDPSGLGLAVSNRLNKAAGFHIIQT